VYTNLKTSLEVTLYVATK